MRIKFVEIQNFRKLESVRIDFAEETTLLVGANNSGKTSAMIALRRFLIDKNAFSTNDFTLARWTELDQIGESWLGQAGRREAPTLSLADWQPLLPSLDLWLDVDADEIHRVQHILPTLSWTKGLLGIRLRYQPKKLVDLYTEFTTAMTAALETKATAEKQRTGAKKYSVNLWPETLRDFLVRRMRSQFEVSSFILDPTKIKSPDHGLARPQILSVEVDPLEGDPLKGLIRIDQVPAQRGFSDATQKDDDSHMVGDRITLTGQFIKYYKDHLNPTEAPEAADIDALEAIEEAHKVFNERLRTSFGPSMKEMESLNYPGVSDPKITIATKIEPTDGLQHTAAVQYELAQHDLRNSGSKLRLPEEYNGLGYQNLISIAFRLMAFRDGWMKVGKASKRLLQDEETVGFPPLHLVLIEEPEAHLHVQAQQVFVKQAYQILRNQPALGKNKTPCTQLVVSTHSSHVAHESPFQNLRYFRRLPADAIRKVPISIVINLSEAEVFGTDKETPKFVARYLEAVHCDLFFADAAILVEGPSERMLVPHFIRHHYPKLNQAYVTVLEIGGSHAHRFRTLIEHLGLITLIITDIDSAEAAGHHKRQQPRRNAGLITINDTLKSWIPELDSIDALLDLPATNKIKEHSHSYGVRVAYQVPIQTMLVEGQEPVELIPDTFEDALAYENIALFRGLKGSGVVKLVSEALQATDPTELGSNFFELLKTARKAEFALDLLFLEDPKSLKAPLYICDGLTWLQDELQRKQIEVVAQHNSGEGQ